VIAQARISVIIPARNEAANISGVLDRIFGSISVPCEVLVVVDADDDPTWPVIRAYARTEPRLCCLVSSYGPGPANAVRYGIDAAEADIAVVTMADGCDDVAQIGDLADLVEHGAVVAAASRYCSGGRQVGGPLIKGLLSRAAGRSLHLLARVGTRDATNSFKAYSTAFVREAGIDSRRGFAIGIELTAKARRLRRPVAELPTTWLERPAGASSFRIAAWLPVYLRWYRFCFGPRLTVAELRTRCEAAQAHTGDAAADSAGGLASAAARSLS
jgi:glycosyltransferase involved in cell wall biosynthesis